MRPCSSSSKPSPFQSTPSARRATCGAFWQVVGSLISIHALREESDLRQAAKRQSFYKFQSTPSARRATYKTCTVLL